MLLNKLENALFAARFFAFFAEYRVDTIRHFRSLPYAFGILAPP